MDRPPFRCVFFLRLIGFLIILAIILSYFAYVLTPNYPYGTLSLLNYYRTDAEHVDVLAVGTSLTYTDLKAITYLPDTTEPIRTVLCSYGILNPLHRLRCIYECVEPDQFWEFALAFPHIHGNFTKLAAQDYKLPPESGKLDPSWKGYLEKNATTAHETPELDFSFNTARNVNLKEQEYFEKILQLCQKEEVPVFLIGYPNADYRHDHLFYCTAFEIAERYGVSGINYNLPENRPAKLNYSTDCVDWQHLNVRGSVMFTRALGEDLRKLFALEDHRGDPAYASFDACAELWFAKFPKFDRRNYES